MKLYEFLAELLKTQGQVLQRLSALFGEEDLIELLENFPEDWTPTHATPTRLPAAEWLDLAPLTKRAPGPFDIDPYRAIEGTVQELDLPPPLEFYLWAYPHYRSFIESPFELMTPLKGPGNDGIYILAEDCLLHARAWVRAIPISSTLAPRAESAAEVPWLRFRTEILKRLGKRALGPVY